MSTRETSAADDPVIESRDQLVLPMQRGEKPKADWRIGTEHEKLVFRRDDFRAPSYDEPGGIRDILLSLERFGWEPVEEGGKVIAMRGVDGTVSLEPAGQLELSGAPLENLHETCAETGR
ncbi:MAG: glutamate--cysteine ligase, partial [Citromicrobium sp.]